MKLILVRHLKVNYRWKSFYNSKGYEKACADYDLSGVVDSGFVKCSEFEVITSTMIRSVQTSKIIFGKDPDFTDDSICEVPMKPFITTSILFPKIMWDVVGRIQWRLGIKTQAENYLDSINRINKFIDKLVLQDRNYIVICHGWVIKLMIKQLKKKGFSGQQPLYIKHGVLYEYVR